MASTAGQWIVVLAFRYADASVLAPFSYIQLLWVSMLGFLIFGEVPDVWTVIGAAFIVASGLYTAHRERVRHSQLVALAASRRRTREPRFDFRDASSGNSAVAPASRQTSHRQRDRIFHLAQAQSSNSIEAMPSSRVSLFFRNAS